MLIIKYFSLLCFFFYYTLTCEGFSSEDATYLLLPICTRKTSTKLYYAHCYSFIHEKITIGWRTRRHNGKIHRLRPSTRVDTQPQNTNHYLLSYRNTAIKIATREEEKLRHCTAQNNILNWETLRAATIYIFEKS